MTNDNDLIRRGGDGKMSLITWKQDSANTRRAMVGTCEVGRVTKAATLPFHYWAFWLEVPKAATARYYDNTAEGATKAVEEAFADWLQRAKLRGA